jgi:hypothetical protein
MPTSEMELLENIQYQYAYNDKRQLIDIRDLTKGNKNGYGFLTCPGCGSELRPRLGNIREKHFWHYSSKQHACESYLHSVAKAAFREFYQKRIANKESYILKIPNKESCNCCSFISDEPCVFLEKEIEYDITKYFKDIIVEEKSGEFRPDIILKSKTKQRELWIEIFVNSPVGNNKIKSGNPIIEIHIQTIQDVRNLLCDQLDLKQYNIYNFKPISINYNYQTCPHKGESFNYFIIYKNGKSRLTSSPEPISKMLKSKTKIQYFKRIEKDTINSNLYFQLVENAAKEGVKVENCGFCVYRVLCTDFAELPRTGQLPVIKIACGKSLKNYEYKKRQNQIIQLAGNRYDWETVNSNKAVDCEYYEKSGNCIIVPKVIPIKLQNI